MLKNANRMTRIAWSVAKPAPFQTTMTCGRCDMTTTALPTLTLLKQKTNQAPSTCSNSSKEFFAKPHEKQKLPTEDRLPQVESVLKQNLTEIFIRHPDYKIYLEDRILGRTASVAKRKLFKSTNRITRIPWSMAKTATRPTIATRGSRNMTTTTIPTLTALKLNVDKEPLTRSNSSKDDPAKSGTSGGSGEKQKLPTEDLLRQVASVLQQDLTEIFLRHPDYRIYRQDIVLEDRIWGRTAFGGVEYIKLLSMARIFAHLRFVIVFFKITSVSVDSDFGAVVIKWRVLGMSALKMAINYFPKKLYKSDNMMKEIPVYKEGISTYFVDGEGKIYRHVIDSKEEDRDSRVVAKSTMDKLKEKIEAIRGKEASPVMYKKTK